MFFTQVLYKTSDVKLVRGPRVFWDWEILRTSAARWNNGTKKVPWLNLKCSNCNSAFSKTMNLRNVEIKIQKNVLYFDFSIPQNRWFWECCLNAELHFNSNFFKKLSQQVDNFSKKSKFVDFVHVLFWSFVTDCSTVLFFSFVT